MLPPIIETESLLRSEEDEAFEKMCSVFRSSPFRTAVITTVVGYVVGSSASPVLVKAAGVAGMLYGGFKLIDSFSEKNHPN